MARLFVCIYVLIFVIQDVSSTQFPVYTFLEERGPPFRLNFQYLCNAPIIRNARCCSCSPDCMASKTCCIDYLWDETNSTELNTYLDEFINKTRVYKDQVCSTVLSQPARITNEYLMVSTCLPYASKFDTNQCLNQSDQSYEAGIPVIASDHYLYRNQYCAKCNDVLEFSHVNISIKCVTENPDPFNTLSVFDKYSDCKFEIDTKKPDSIQICGKFNKPDKTCHRDNKYYDLCKSHVGIVGEYANYYCYRCNNPVFITGIPESLFKICDGLDPFGPPFRWSIIINFSGRTQISVQGPGVDTTFQPCKENEKYDPIQRQCRAFTCTTGYKLTGSICVKNPLLEKTVFVNNPQFDTCLLSREPTLYFKVTETKFDFRLFTNEFQQQFVSKETFSNFSLNNHTYLQRTRNIDEIEMTKLIQVLQNTNSKLWNYIDVAYVTSIKYQIQTQHYGFDASRSFTGQRLCSRPLVMHAMQTNFTPQCHIDVNNITKLWKDVSSYIIFTKHDISQLISTCEEFHLHSSCKLSTVTENYSIHGYDTLIIQKSDTENITFTADQYVPLKNGFGVCHINKNERSQWKWLDSVKTVENYIALIGVAVSIFCYICIILTLLMLQRLKKSSRWKYHRVMSCLTTCRSIISYWFRI